MRNFATNRLMARAAIHQVEMLGRADALADAVDAAIRGVWERLLAAMRFDHGFTANQARAAKILGELPGLVAGEMALGLGRLFRASHAEVAQATVAVLPKPYLRALTGEAAVVEAILEDKPGPSAPGFVTIGFKGIEKLPRLKPGASPDEGKDFLQALLFPAPDEGEVLRRLGPVVQPANWQALGNGAAKKMPQELAQLIAQSTARGNTQAQTAKELLPYFDGSRTRARRSARTFGMLVSNHGALAAHEQLGDMLVGYQIHATHDQHTRPHHAARDGTIYYKDPKPGQKGLDEMPRPPLEADGSVAFH